MSLRTDLARRAQRLVAPTNVSIVSDDCWGGQYYRSLGLPYLTPTVGCWVEPAHYLDFVEHFADDNALRPLSVRVEKTYPVLTTRHARLHFIHDHDPRQVAETFERRVARLNFERLFVKIDLGKGYTPVDVRRWNALALPRVLALYPAGYADAVGGAIHQGVEVTDWVEDAAINFYVSRRHFDLLTWLRTGTLENRALKRGFYTLFGDPFWKDTLRRRYPRRAHRAVPQP